MEYFALKSGKLVDQNQLRLLAFQAVQPTDEHYVTFLATVDALLAMLGSVSATSPIAKDEIA